MFTKIIITMIIIKSFLLIILIKSVNTDVVNIHKVRSSVWKKFGKIVCISWSDPNYYIQHFNELNIFLWQLLFNKISKQNKEKPAVKRFWLMGGSNSSLKCRRDNSQ